MASEEQYLDDLLKSMMENEPQERTMEDAMRDVKASSYSDKAENISSDDLADMLDEIEANTAVNDIKDDLSLEEFAIPGAEEEIAADGLPENETVVEESVAEEEPYIEEPNLEEEVSQPEEVTEDEAWKSEIDELFGSEDEKNTETVSEDMDVTGMIDQMESPDENLADISEMLKMSDSSEKNEVSDEDMLALLEGLQDSDSNEQELVQEEQEEGTQETAKKEKKKGFFARLLDILTQEVEEPEETETEREENTVGEANATDENGKILEELNEEDKAKKKKKKGKKNKKGKKEEAESGEETEEEAEENVKEKKKKKPKKEKKEKQEKVKMPPSPKVLSKRAMAVLVAFCATLVACIIFLSNFLPEYADKVQARSAYYAGDYQTVYTNLNHKSLNSSDEIIYTRAKQILSLQRKLDSYYNRMELGKELEAVDALFQGAEKYQKLMTYGDAGIQESLTKIYAQICDVLQNNYGVSQDEIAEINAYDDVTYTKKLNSLVYGTEFYLPGEEPVEEEPPMPPQDVLPEEEEFIDMGDSL